MFERTMPGWNRMDVIPRKLITLCEVLKQPVSLFNPKCPKLKVEVEVPFAKYVRTQDHSKDGIELYLAWNNEIHAHYIAEYKNHQLCNANDDDLAKFIDIVRQSFLTQWLDWKNRLIDQARTVGVN